MKGDKVPSKVEWAENQDALNDRGDKYGSILRNIREANQVGKWAIVMTFERDGSARDLASKLRREHKDFMFTSAVTDEGTVVYAQWMGVRND